MASTFTLNSQSYDGRYLSLTCVQTQDVANNKSIVKWTLTAKGGNSNYYSTGPTKVVINGVQVYYSARVAWDDQTFPSKKGSVSGTLEIAHESNGTKSVACSISTAIYYSSVQTKSGTWYLDDIPRGSGVSCSAANIGSASTITITKSSTEYTHTLKYEFYSLSGTIVEKTSESTYSFVLPTSFYAEIPDSQSGTGKIICETYSGNTLVETTECPFTANVNKATSDPVVSPTIKDTNEATIALTGDDSVLVRYFSNASVTTGAEARNSATIKSQTTTNGTTTLSGAACSFEGVESGVFSFVVEDSRGFVVYPGRDLTATNKFIEYILPTCNLGNNKLDGEGNITVFCSGSFFNGSFGAVDNTLTAEYRYREYGGSFGGWTPMEVTKTNNRYTADAYLTGLDYQKTYVFETRVTDKLTTVSSNESSVTSFPIFHWSKNDFVFEVPVTFNAGASGAVGEGDQTITGNLRLKGDGNYGNYLYFGDGSYAYIAELTDDVLTMKANSIVLDANNVKVNGAMIPTLDSGRWSPTLTGTFVNSYTAREGWYHRVGNVVTIGWNVKADVQDGNVGITGVPYTPMFSAFGGGIAHMIYIAADFSFEGWAINESGVITPRLQPCNRTSTGALQISSSAQYDYGSLVTLAGTICYITNQ